MSRRVVVTGLGCITPLGNNVSDFTRALQEGESGAGLITRFDTEDFDVKIACEVQGFSLADFLDRAQAKSFRRTGLTSHYALAAAEEAMEEAGIALQDIGDPFRASSIMGVGIGDIGSFEKQVNTLAKKGPGKVSAFTVPKLMPNSAAADIANRFQLHGDSFTLNSACSSATNAIGMAFRAIKEGHYDLIVTGGAEATVTPTTIAGFSAMGAITKQYNNDPRAASRPFDLHRSGFVTGEGAGVLILEDRERAMKRRANILAEVVGYGGTNDAGHITQPCETGEYAARAIRLALNEARIPSRKVDYINAHGTSTPLNDKTETLAIKRALRAYAQSVAISSTKSMHGHALGAAGALEAIVAIEAMRTGVVPPTINLDDHDPECDLNYTPNEARERRIKYALSETFGFGGHNGVVLFKKVA